MVKAQKTYLWVNAGATVSTQIQSQKGGARSSIWGPYLGTFVRTVFPTEFGYEAGLFYTTKGTRFTDSSFSGFSYCIFSNIEQNFHKR